MTDIKQVHWFPGHIAKTITDFKNISSEVDCFFVLVDARAPRTTFLDNFKDITKQNNVIVIITKSDLVDKSDLSFWVNEYKKNYKDVIFVNLKNPNETKKKIISSLKEIKFDSLMPKFAMLGVPNVGKSTLTNILLGTKRAKVENKPGLTRNRTWYQFDRFFLMDSPGILQPRFDDFEIPYKLALIGSIRFDILPIENVVEYFYDYLKRNNIENKLISNKLQTKDDFRKVIVDFQNNRFGKIILDK